MVAGRITWKDGDFHRWSRLHEEKAEHLLFDCEARFTVHGMVSIDGSFLQESIF